MQMYNGMTNRQRAQVLVEALPYIQTVSYTHLTLPTKLEV